MTTRRATARRFEVEIANAGVPLHGNQDSPQVNQPPPEEHAPQGDQVLVIPPAMTDGEIRSTFIILSQVMTTQAQVISIQAQATKAQENLEV